jgi:glycosyltransferase involved in cell wall biosynthesis
MRKRRLLVSAYGCEPGKGSEQGVGWNWVLQLANLAELVVVTRANNREAIKASLPEELAERIRFVYYDLPKQLRAFKRKERGLYLYYLLWQWGAYRTMRRELAPGPVTYAIHLTFGSIWMPTFMHRLPVPFIWGPVGGGEAVPWSLIQSLPLKGQFIQYARYLLMATFTINPLVTSVARKACIILTRTEDTARIIPARYSEKVRVVLETAAAEHWFAHPPANLNTSPDNTLEVIYTGRLVPLKNLDMAIRAISAARQRGAKIRFTIVGDGPLRSALERRAAAEGIDDVVTFTGRCTQDEVLSRLGASDVYLFPSLKEGGVWSLMEAMALGLPSVCVNTSGMAVIADISCARLIETGSPDDMVEAFADALSELAANPQLRRRMGMNARHRLNSHFRWEQKGAFMNSLFEDLEQGKL